MDFIKLLRETLKKIHIKEDELELLSATNEEGAIALLQENQDIKVVLLDSTTENENFGKQTSAFIRKYLKNKIIQILFINSNSCDSESVKTNIAKCLYPYNDLQSIVPQIDTYKTSKTYVRKEIERIMGKGKVISEIFAIVEDYAKQDCALLFEGETGVGKKEIVTYLHSISPRKEKKLVTVDCGTIPETLIESELFGCNKGAYTDAKEDRIGKIEIANGGTLFLDEINSLSKAMQVKLLHLIQEKEITRVGDNKPMKIDVRIVAAGNEYFKDLIKNKQFRRDLYERFVDRITIPTLAERKEDMDFFINRFIEEKATELGKKEVLIDKEARHLVKNYTWEGNIRQLMNFIYKLVIRVKYDDETKTYIIHSDLVKKCLLAEIKTSEDEANDNDFTWKTAIKTAMKMAIKRALKMTNGNNEKARALLDISNTTYYDWKKELEIND